MLYRTKKYNIFIWREREQQNPETYYSCEGYRFTEEGNAFTWWKKCTSNIPTKRNVETNVWVIPSNSYYKIKIEEIR